MKKIILLGCGGHAKSVIDTLEQSGEYKIVGFLETIEKSHLQYRGYAVIGTEEDLPRLRKEGIEFAFITVGYMENSHIRTSLYNKIKAEQYKIPTIIDKTAYIACDSLIEDGSFIGKQAIVNANTHIGKNCIINTQAIIEHDCKIGDGTHIAVGSIICGGCKLGYDSIVGANSVIIQNIEVGNSALIGAGSVVIRDVPSNVTVVGNPAKIIKKNEDK